MKEIALKMASLPKVGTKKTRIIVITQGKDPTLVAQGKQIDDWTYCTVHIVCLLLSNAALPCIRVPVYAQSIQNNLASQNL